MEEQNRGAPASQGRRFCGGSLLCLPAATLTMESSRQKREKSRQTESSTIQEGQEEPRSPRSFDYGMAWTAAVIAVRMAAAVD